MTNYSDVRIFLCTTPTDMHYIFDRLLGRTRKIFKQDPLDGHLFLFLNQSRDRLKFLFSDHDGYRQMERARIRTATRDPLRRLLFAGIALLLRNGKNKLRP